MTDPPSSDEYRALMKAAEALMQAALYMEQLRMLCNDTGLAGNDQASAELRSQMQELETIVIWTVSQYVFAGLSPELRSRAEDVLAQAVLKTLRGSYELENKLTLGRFSGSFVHKIDDPFNGED